MVVSEINKLSTKTLTLHPAFPLVCLLSIEEAEIFAFTLDSRKARNKSQNAESRKHDYVKLLLLLCPKTYRGQSIRKSRHHHNLVTYQFGLLQSRCL